MNRNVSKSIKSLFSILLILMVISCNALDIQAHALLMDQSDDELSQQNYEEAYRLRVNRSDISFGTYTEGTYVQNQEIIVYNNGTGDAWLTWNLTDPSGAFSVDAPNDNYLPAGGQSSFYVYPKRNTAPGSYTASLLIGDTSDTGYARGVSVALSETVTSPQPRITGVSISPTSSSATRGGIIRFNASVYGENDFSRSVNWSISGQSSGNTYIDSNGVLSIGNDENATSITVRVESSFDRNYSATANVNITKDNYTISTSSSPSEGGTTYGGGTVSQGDSVVLTASPASGYRFINWTCNGGYVSDSARYQVNNVGSNMSYVANFQKTTCYIKTTSNIPQAGNVTESFSVNYNTSATVTATAKDGYRFDGWYEGNNRVSTSSSYTINNVTSDHTLNAVFVKNTYEVKVTINGNTGGVVAGVGTYNAGTNATLIATPSNGYTFVSWMMGGKEYSKDRNITIYNVSQDYNLVAYFVKDDAVKYNITSSVNDNNGHISPAGTYQVPKGTSVVYTITPNSGYSVAAVYVDGVAVGPVINYTFNYVVSDHTITASFVKNPVATPAPTVSPTPSAPLATVAPANTPSPEAVTTAEPTQEPTTVPTADPYDVEVQVVPVDTGLLEETGVLQQFNLRDDEALAIIRSGNGQELFEAAIENGSYQVSIYNELNPEANGVAVSALRDASVPNFAQVLNGLLNEDQKMRILHGEKIGISLNIFGNSSFIADSDRMQFTEYEKKSDVVIDQYFDIVLMLTDAGYTMPVEKLPVPMTIVIDVPQELMNQNSELTVLRLHTDDNGVSSITPLNDEDNNPATITFTTDRFSSYAIAHYSNGTLGQATNGSDKTKLISILEFALAGVGSLLVLSIIGAIITGKKKK